MEKSLDFMRGNIRHHNFLDVDIQKIKSEIEGIMLKFSVHGLSEKQLVSWVLQLEFYIKIRHTDFQGTSIYCHQGGPVKGPPKTHQTSHPYWKNHSDQAYSCLRYGVSQTVNVRISCLGSPIWDTILPSLSDNLCKFFHLDYNRFWNNFFKITFYCI